MPRLEGWEERLHAVLRRHAKLPFSWGQSDCFILPADAVEASTGTDPWAAERPYDSAAHVVRRLAELGAKDIGDLFAKAFPEIHPSVARRGDIGRATYPGAELGGGVVVIGADVIGKGERGLVRLPLSAMTRAFKVG